jgi:hypothetical protein
MTHLIPEAICPVCGVALLITFRTIGPAQKTFEYFHDRVPSDSCLVTINQPDAGHYEEMTYEPLIQQVPMTSVQ